MLEKFLLGVPVLLSLYTTSDISNSFRGRGMFLLWYMVFNTPGSNAVLATCKTKVRVMF